MITKKRKAETAQCKERFQRRLADRMPLLFSSVHYLSSEKREMEWGRGDRRVSLPKSSLEAPPQGTSPVASLGEET